MPEYTLGPSTYQSPHARFETKRHDPRKEGSDSAAGYQRWRSWEFVPESARKGKQDVVVDHHRLLAVVACYPEDMPVGEIIEHLKGRDVHHNEPSIPESCGVKWDDRPDAIQVRDHGAHSEITQAEMRAWAADDRDRVRGDREPTDGEVCDRCGADADVLGTSSAWPDEQRCLECAKETTDGDPIEVG